MMQVMRNTTRRTCNSKDSQMSHSSQALAFGSRKDAAVGRVRFWPRERNGTCTETRPYRCSPAFAATCVLEFVVAAIGFHPVPLASCFLVSDLSARSLPLPPVWPRRKACAPPGEAG